MTEYLVIRGPIGSGKSTLARRLAKVLTGKRVSIDRILEEDDLERWEKGFVAESSFLQANAIAAQ
ncbi:MAG: AAA family ATPase, partial [Thermoplasmata archaeon]|nr:AAA family ATPase [Thermoplasmata archaeon]